jgi:natural product precursor
MKNVLLKFADNVLSKNEMKDLKGGNMPEACYAVCKAKGQQATCVSISTGCDCPITGLPC